MKKKTKSKTKTGKPAAKLKVSSKAKTKKIIAASIGGVTACIVGYFTWHYFQQKKGKQTGSNPDFDAVLKESNNLIQPVSVTQPVLPVTSKVKTKSISSYNISTAKTTSSTSGFPLQKGSKGDLVKQLQQALITKYGKSILPKYGADGDFSSETVNALKKKGLSTTIDESTFNVIVSETKENFAALGRFLNTATAAGDFNKVMELLAKIKTVDDYSAANAVYKTYPLGLVHKTIVNGLMDAFPKTAQKDKIKGEFLRIGLQFDGSKWSLSGLDGTSLITIEPTIIWVNAKESVKVPAKMVLGNEIARRLDYTLFENKGKYFLVNTKSVTYL